MKIAGRWDEQLLARLLAELSQSPDVNVTLSGFRDEEVSDLLRTLEAREKRERLESLDLDAAIDEATRQSRTRPGDIWLLGEHGLVRGDATKGTDVERLLGDRRPAMAFTDPPYNVDYGKHGGGRGRGSRQRWRS